MSSPRASTIPSESSISVSVAQRGREVSEESVAYLVGEIADVLRQANLASSENVEALSVHASTDSPDSLAAPSSGLIEDLRTVLGLAYSVLGRSQTLTNLIRG